MNLSSESELIGENSGELEIKGQRADTVVKLTLEGKRKLLAMLSGSAGETSSSRIYLILENITGSHDATILNIYIDLPRTEKVSKYRQLPAGSTSLYGLRRASIPGKEEEGLGLTSVFDITQRLVDLQARSQLDSNEIRVSILPNHSLPESSDIVIERISLHFTP